MKSNETESCSGRATTAQLLLTGQHKCSVPLPELICSSMCWLNVHERGAIDLPLTAVIRVTG